MVQLSYWEKQSLTNYDFAIIGGGIVGLSTAAALLERNPHARVVVLERGLLPTGASTRNAGFACFGSVSELAQDVDTMGEEALLKLVSLRWNGLKLLRKRLGDQAMAYENHGGYELISSFESHYLDRITDVNELLKELFPGTVFRQADELIPALGFNSKRISHLIFNPYEGQIDTGEMMHALWQYVQKLGGRILTGCEVQEWNEGSSKVEIKVRSALKDDQLCISASRIAVCTNAFTSRFFDSLPMKPGRGQVLITHPVAALNWKGVFHYQEGYYYFRNVGKRLLLGGGRNLDFEGETTAEMATNPAIMQVLYQMIEEIILPGKTVKIDQQWAGIMAFGPDKQPLVQALSPHIVMGVRLGGMGVAIGSMLGQQLANMLLE